MPLPLPRCRTPLSTPKNTHQTHQHTNAPTHQHTNTPTYHYTNTKHTNTRTHKHTNTTQSTYCEQLWNHCQAIGRAVHCVNLDPAAEAFGYPVSIDVRDLVALEDVMEEMGLGPNG